MRRAPHLPPVNRARRRQRGVMLIEALIAILIFSIGILGVVGMQASAVKQSTDARYRAEAAQLVDQLLGQMWTSNRTAASLQAQFNSCGSSCAGYQAWYNQVRTVLPGVSDGADSDTKPQVVIDNAGIVTITIYWRAPGEDEGAAPNRYDVQSQIGQ